ncbi:MAG: SHOCT domain-containing protein [Calditrichia bacterium]
MWHDMGWGGLWFGWLFWIIIFIVIIWLVVRFAGGSQTRQQPPASGETPLDVLKKRYARGEITREQYEQMRKDIEK